MRLAARILLAGALFMLAGFGAWRVVATGMSDHLAVAHPLKALEWDPHNPVALAALARQQWAAHKPQDVRETALNLLAHEPLYSTGFVLLFDVAKAQAEVDKPGVTRLAKLALRRAPFALGPRAWLADEQISQGRYGEALDSIDRLMRVSGTRQEDLFPVLIAFAETPALADILAAKLAEQPAWRDGFIQALLSKPGSDGPGLIFSRLKQRQDLKPTELRHWLARLGEEGRWGEAYARWASTLDPTAMNRLTSVYNGGFETLPSGYGFDWRIDDSPGVLIERAPVEGAGGSYALRLNFLGRRVEAIPLRQWLLLTAGSYRLHFRVDVQNLRSERGLQWVIRCLDSGTQLAASERMNGSSNWSEQDVDFDVPEQDCAAQELWMRNAGYDGAGKIILGTIVFDDFAIERTARH